MIEVRTPKDARYNSEENETEWYWVEKFPRTALDKYSHPAQFQQYHPGMWWQPDYLDSQGDPVGYQHCVRMACKQAPKTYSLWSMWGGGGTSTQFEDQKG